MKPYHRHLFFSLFIIGFFLASCSGASSVQCSKGKSKVKPKSFALKKNKRAKRSVPIKSASTSPQPSQRQVPATSPPVTPPPLEDAQEPETPVLIEEDIISAEEPIAITNEDIEPPSNTVEEDKIPEGPVVFQGKTYDEEEDITFNANISFIPNHDIVRDKKSATKKLQELVNLLEQKPNAKVDIIGNVGWGTRVRKGSTSTTVDDDEGGRYEIYFGTGEKIYPQKVFTSDVGYKAIVIRNGRKPKDHIIIGNLMQTRAEAVKEILVELGVDASRLTVKKGEFFSTPDRFVSFVIEQ